MFQSACLLTLLWVSITFGFPQRDELFEDLLDENSTERDETDEDKSISAGIWKCGNCTDLENSKIVYNEENFIDDLDVNESEESEIELVLEGMRCVTVSANQAGVVKRLTGSCDGHVTLHMTRASHFLVQVYV